MTTRLLVGDARDRIAEIPDGTVDLVVTSPPFLALRKYGDNDAEMGSEGTPADFLDALLDLTVEFRRVLAPHGSIAIELGDTYSGARGYGTPEDAIYGKRHEEMWEVAKPDRRFKKEDDGWPLAKSLALIPQLYPASLAYGRNLLNPDHTFTPWRVRNIITWCRPNPPVGALGDKVRPATSYITVACPSAKRYFDLDGVRTDLKVPEAATLEGARYRRTPSGSISGFGPGGRPDQIDKAITSNPAGAPPLDWWDDTLDPDDPTDHMTIVMPTQAYPGAHYATWPAKLAQRLIDMMCPLKVCVTCGRPSERIVDYERTFSQVAPGAGRSEARTPKAGPMGSVYEVKRDTLGWSDCGHDNWRPGHVLDPFAGSGTTLAVAMGMGRDATGIELYSSNASLIRERVGMFLEVDGPTVSITETRPL